MKTFFVLAMFVCSSLFAGSFKVSGDLPTTGNSTQDSKQDDKKNQDETDDDIESAARKIFMRGKLVSNQHIVEGLSMKDFKMIQQGANSVTALMKGQHWFVIDTPEYRRYSEDMGKAASRLNAAAKQQNLEASALRYFDLTLTCIDCHEYVQKTQH